MKYSFCNLKRETISEDKFTEEKEKAETSIKFHPKYGNPKFISQHKKKKTQPQTAIKNHYMIPKLAPFNNIDDLTPDEIIT